MPEPRGDAEIQLSFIRQEAFRFQATGAGSGWERVL
jgi:hypothetical protein